VTSTALQRSLLAIAALVSLSLIHGTASADTRLRVGKAQPNQFAFVPADIGVETGIFKKHGLAVETSAFGADARMMQALTADGIDIALSKLTTEAYLPK
jgi:ABC-type nitrate/sulfonate/bicarbonate transport system substrate-binding protein